MNIEKELEVAKKRLEERRKARKARQKQRVNVSEPEHLISGQHDEVGIKREEKFGGEDD